MVKRIGCQGVREVAAMKLLIDLKLAQLVAKGSSMEMKLICS